MYNNDFIANMLDKIASLLEIKEENRFKIRAYRMAAACIRELTFSVAKIEEVKKLWEIPGIGKAIAEKIMEISSTGSCETLRSLVEEIPESLLDFLKIEGLGPKRVGILYRDLGIQNAQTLKEFALNGKIQELNGFGPKIVQKILDGLEHWEERKGRFPLDQVVPKVQSLLAAMRSIPGVTQAEVAGSSRRWKETVKDLDILVTGDKEHAGSVMDVFTAYPEVESVLSQGATKATVRWTMGIQVDLRFVDSDCFGAGMQYFTGSKEHNIALRTLAKDKGFKTSEYGLFKISGSKETKVAGQNEEEFYRCLGMDYIPPEMRENAGEIEAALSGKLPCLLEHSDICGDLQMHTTESDGKNSLEEMAQAAIALGYKFIAITDHSKAMHIAHGLDEARLLRWIETIHKTREKYPQFHLLAGVEVDILKDGSLDLEEKVLRECDVVVASVHSSLHINSQDMTKRIIQGISHPFVHILAHPTSRIIQQREPIEYDFDKVLEAAIQNHVAMEVNSSPQRLDLKDILVRKVIECKGWISVNTDAHSCDQLLFMKYGVHTARRGWCKKEDCINTFGIDKLKSFLSKKL